LSAEGKAIYLETMADEDNKRLDFRFVHTVKTEKILGTAYI